MKPGQAQEKEERLIERETIEENEQGIAKGGILITGSGFWTQKYLFLPQISL